MSGPIEIQVVYDGSGRRRGGRLRNHSTRLASRLTLAVVGLLSLAVCGAMYYGIWWRVDPFIFMTFMLKTPIEMQGPSTPPAEAEPDLNDAAEVMFRIQPDEPETAPAEASPEAAPAGEGPRWTGRTAQAIIPVVGYSWLTLATIGCCALGMAAGASLASADGRAVQVGGGILAALVLIGLCAGGFHLWQKYSLGFPVRTFRYGMGGVVLLCTLVGMTLRNRVRGCSRLASFTIILAAAGSSAGLYLWHQAGAVEPQHATPAFLALVFVAHSAWGWLLLPISTRL